MLLVKKKKRYKIEYKLRFLFCENIDTYTDIERHREREWVRGDRERKRE